jgi:uncharacterized repeat protein (TIGR02543 family)
MRIFKSITIFLLVLFMASCNVSSSTSQSTSNTSSSNQSSAIVNSVSSIELTSTSSLNQFIGLTSKIVVNAKLNSGAAENVVLDWYVDSEKSLTQTGLSFEFFPTAVKTYVIQARVGGVLSNTINISVGLPKFNLNNIEAPTNSQLSIRGDAGITFNVSGINVASSSSYNLASQTYTLNLLSPMVQGTTYNITASKAGFESTTVAYLYETRKLTVSSILYKGARVSANTDGAFEIQKPFTGASSQNYTVSLQQTNLDGSSVPITIITNVPSGATAIAPYQTTLTLQKGINITRDYTLNSDSTPGLYTHNISVNNVNLVVRILVSNPLPSLTLTTPIVFDLAATTNGGTPLADPFAVDAGGETIKKVVKPNAAGQYIITRPYNGSAYELTFTLAADNFPTPLGFPASPATPYNVIAALTGPSGGVMYYGSTVNNLTTTYPFRETTGNNYRVTQYVDNKTTLGTYSYTFTATGYNLNVTRNITVVVREFVPEIEPVLSFNNVELKANSDGSFTIYKPLGSNTLTASISAKIKNYESPLASTFTGGAGVTTLYNDGSTLRYLLDTRVTYSGPLSSVTPLVTKLGIELGSGSTTTNTVASQTSPAVNYTSYTNTGAERSIDLVALRDVETYNSSTGIFAAMATISSTTFPGIHTYTVQIGGLTRAFIFRVVEPTPLIITRDNVVEYGATSGTASKDNVTFKEEDNKYYVNGVNGTLKINVLPFGMPTGEYPYTFTKRTPSGSFQSSTNLVALTIKTSPAYDGSLTFPGSGAGSEMAVNEVLTEEGEYVYTFNINNQLKEIRVIVLAAPQLKVESVTINSLPVTEFNNIYYVNHSTSTRYIEFNLTPVNVETTYKYVLNNTGAFPTGSTLTSALQELVIVDGKMTVGVTLPARTSATVAETHTYLIALYKGSLQIGAVTKVVITSQPVYSTIFFNSNGGTVVASKTQFVATAVSAPTPPTRTDFDFASWHVKPDLTDTAIDFSAYFTPETDAILFAKWSQFTITYNLDGGVNYASAPTVFASTSATITLGTPTKGSSTFVGWFTAASGGSQVTTIPSGSSANVTVFARWS